MLTIVNREKLLSGFNQVMTCANTAPDIETGFLCGDDYLGLSLDLPTISFQLLPRPTAVT